MESPSPFLGPSRFPQIPALPAELSAGQSCTFSIVFPPTAATGNSGELTVTDNDPAPQSVSLFGTGLNSSATLAPLDRNFLQFGKQTAGTTSNVQFVELQNIGNTSLTFTNPLSGASPNAFQATNDCSGTIPAASTCDVEVKFTPPTGTGPFFETLTIQSAAAGAPQTIALSGTGIPASTASLLPKSLVFPVIATGQSSTPQYAFLNNTGTTADILTFPTIVGADFEDFQLTSAPAQSCFSITVLNAQAVCAIGVVFTPTQPGLRTATLQVTDTATEHTSDHFASRWHRGGSAGSGDHEVPHGEFHTGTAGRHLHSDRIELGRCGYHERNCDRNGYDSVRLDAGVDGGNRMGVHDEHMHAKRRPCSRSELSGDYGDGECGEQCGFVGYKLRGRFGRRINSGECFRSDDDLDVCHRGPSFTSTTLPEGFATVSYGATLSVTGGTPPYSFAVTGDGNLPANFTLRSGRRAPI